MEINMATCKPLSRIRIVCSLKVLVTVLKNVTVTQYHLVAAVLTGVHILCRTVRG